MKVYAVVKYNLATGSQCIYGIFKNKGDAKVLADVCENCTVHTYTLIE